MQHKAADETEHGVIEVSRSACDKLQVCSTSKSGSVRQEDRHRGKQTDRKICMSWTHLIFLRKGHIQQPFLQSRTVLEHLYDDIDTAVVAVRDVVQANSQGTCPALSHCLLCSGLLPHLQQVLSALNQS